VTVGCPVAITGFQFLGIPPKGEQEFLLESCSTAVGPVSNF